MQRGVLTAAQLRGSRFRTLYRGIYLPRSERPPDLLTRSRGAFLLVEGTGALAGYSAAELLGASCAPEGAPAEIVAPRTGIRPRPGLLVHRDALPPEDVTTAQGCRVTTALRTAWDLCRRLHRTEAVVALDALARRGRFDPARLLNLRDTLPGSRHARRLDEIVPLAAPRPESPMESRLRLLLIDHGLPPPVVQFELRDRYGFVLARFDLAYPAASWRSSTTVGPTTDPAAARTTTATTPPPSSAGGPCDSRPPTCCSPPAAPLRRWSACSPRIHRDERCC